MPSGIFKDLTGVRFGRLTVKGLSSKRSNQGLLQWNCVCDCGTKRRISTGQLNSPRGSRSCGCLNREAITGANNYQTKRVTEKYGQAISSDDHWYVRAGNLYYRAIEAGIPMGFESILDFVVYVKSIAPDRCPVFGKKFVLLEDESNPMSPSIDKIIPNKGYVRGNIQVISYKANSMKQKATLDQLGKFAQWGMKYAEAT